MLVTKVSVGTCECDCGELVYETTYRYLRGRTVFYRTYRARYAFGHSGKTVDAAPLIDEILRYREKHNLSWKDLARCFGYKTWPRLETQSRFKIETARKLRAVMAKPPKQSLTIDAKPIWNAIVAYKEASNLTWPQMARITGFKSEDHIRRIKVQAKIRKQNAERILRGLAGLTRLPSGHERELPDKIAKAEQESA